MSSHRRSTDIEKKKRNILSFFLFLSIVMLSLSIIGSSVIFNSNAFSEIFTDSTYVSKMQKDIIEYGEDLCRKNSIPKDFMPRVIRYNTIMELEKSYVNNALSVSDEFEVYNDYAYGVLLEQLQVDIENAAKQAVKASGLEIAKGQAETGARTFAQNITEYIQKRVEFSYMDELCDVAGKGKKICSAFVVLSVVACVALIASVFKSDGKKYRKLRNIAISALSASLFDFIMLLAIVIVRVTKDLVIYPTYLAEAFMRHVDLSMATIGITAMLLFIIAIALMACIWTMKRTEKE